MEREGRRFVIYSLINKYTELLKLECYKRAKNFVEENYLKINDFVENVKEPGSLLLQNKHLNINKIVLEIKYTALSQIAIKLVSDGVTIIDNDNCKITNTCFNYIDNFIDEKIKEIKKMIEVEDKNYNNHAKYFDFYCEEEFKNLLDEVLDFNKNNIEEKEIQKISSSYITELKIYKIIATKVKYIHTGFSMKKHNFNELIKINETKEMETEEDNFVYAIDWLFPIKRTYNLIYTGREY